MLGCVSLRLKDLKHEYIRLSNPHQTINMLPQVQRSV